MGNKINFSLRSVCICNLFGLMWAVENTETRKPGLWRPTESALFPMKARTVGVVVLLLIF